MLICLQAVELIGDISAKEKRMMISGFHDGKGSYLMAKGRILIPGVDLHNGVEQPPAQAPLIGRSASAHEGSDQQDKYEHTSLPDFLSHA